MFPFASAEGRTTSSRGRNGGTQEVLDRAPALRDAVERVIVKMVKNLQTMAGATTTIEGMLAGLVMEQAKDVIASHGPDAAAVMLESSSLSAPLLMMLDATLIHAMVELLCGGNGAEPMPSMARAATPIDIQFSQILFTIATSAINAEWAEFGFKGLRATKIDGGLPSDCLGPRGAEVAMVKMTIGAFSTHGAMRLILPVAVLDQFRRDSEHDESGTASADPAWSGLLQKEIEQASVSLDAYLDAKGLTLSTLANLQVGQILALPPEAREKVSLVSDNRILFRGELGHADDLYSLRISEIVVDPKKSPVIELRTRRSPLSDLSKA